MSSAGIVSFKAFCPASPRRGGPELKRPPDIDDFDIGIDIQGRSVTPFLPSPSRALLFTPEILPGSLHDLAPKLSKGAWSKSSPGESFRTGASEQVPADSLRSGPSKTGGMFLYPTDVPRSPNMTRSSDDWTDFNQSESPKLLDRIRFQLTPRGSASKGGARSMFDVEYPPDASVPWSPSKPSTPGQSDTVHAGIGTNIPLRSCQILLPSAGADNDAMRLRCNGRKLGVGLLVPLKFQNLDSEPMIVGKHLGKRMRHTASEPFFSATDGFQKHGKSMNAKTMDFERQLRHTASADMFPSRPSVGGWAASEKQTRLSQSYSEPFFPAVAKPATASRPQTTAKSMSKSASNFNRSGSIFKGSAPKVEYGVSIKQLEYPGLYPPLRPPTPSPILHPMLSRKPRGTGVKMIPGKALPSCRNDHDRSLIAADKNKKMMAALFNLRRAGRPEDEAVEEVVDEKDKKRKSTSPSRSAKKKKTLSVVVEKPPEFFEFTYTFEEHQKKPIKEKVEEELKQRGLPVEEVSQRYAAIDSFGSELEMESPLFEKRFPLSVTLKILKDITPAVEEEVVEPDAEALSDDQEAANEAMKQVSEKELTVMCATLSGCHDNSVDLGLTLEGLEELQRPVLECGGSRHATAIVALRTLLCVRRKHELLQVVEKRKEAFDREAARKEEIFKMVSENTGPCPEGLCHVRQFVSKVAHKPEENPADADKGNFELFAASFGMPKKHNYFLEMLETAKQCVIFWAVQTLELAMNDGESDQIKRHMDVIRDIGAHPSVYDEIGDYMKQCLDILADRLAERCLKIAEQLRDKDAQTVERSKEAQPQSAKDAALAINDEIRRAVSLGAPQKHPMLAEAKRIASVLEAEEKARYAYKAYLSAVTIRARDEKEAAAYEKINGTPPVGPAEEFAVKVEKDIKENIKLGAPPDHKFTQKAIAIGKELRDMDGTRKRMANRAKRQSESANA